MKVNRVKKARKDHGHCGKCGTAIRKGDSYWYIEPRFGPRKLRCSSGDCNFRMSDMVSSDKLQRIWLARENIEDKVKECRDNMSEVASEGWPAWLEELADTIQESAEEIREVGIEYEESAQNVDEYFPGSQQVDDIQDKADRCEEMADQLDVTEGSVRDTASNDPADLSWYDVDSTLDEVDNDICDIEPY